MITNMIRLLVAVSFAVFTAALDCKGLNLEKLDKTFLSTEIRNTPPSVTNYTVYYNPCGAVNVPECASDSHLCLIERVQIDNKWIVSAVKDYGSPAGGMHESVSYGSFQNDNGEDSSYLQIVYSDASWGDRKLSPAACDASCSSNELFKAEFDSYTDGYLQISLDTPLVCPLGQNPPKDGNKDENNPSNPGNGDSGNNDEKKGGHGFFAWVFILLVLFGFVYLSLTVYLNTVRSGRQIQITSMLRDVISDLPYLIGDLLRKVRGFFSSSRGGYSAV